MTRRVAHVLGPSSGGIRRVVRYMADAPPPGYETAAVVGPEDLRQYFADVPFRPLDGFRPWAAFRPEIVHAHGFTAAAHVVISEKAAGLRSAVRSPGAKGGRRFPVVVTIHTARAQTLRGGSITSAYSWTQDLLWTAGRIVAGASDALIAPSHEVARDLRGAIVIAPAIELPQPLEPRVRVREMLGTPKERVVVLAVARLHPDKALDVFIEAVAGTGAEGWIAGEGPERTRLEGLAAGSGVRLLGQRGDVGSLLSAADIFALPAAGEAYGFAVLEAVAAGLPVVATRTGAIPEIAGDAAVLVEPGDRHGFIEATRLLIASSEARAELAGRARRRTLPSPRYLVAEVGKVYDKVCDDFRRRRRPADEKMP